MKLFYQGVDIFDEVSINQCIYDSYGEQRPDTLRIVFNDGNDLWDNWKPQEGDKIKVILGACNTGEMYVTEITPVNGKMTLRASSVPVGCNNKFSKSWEQIKFKQLCIEIAKRHGMTCDFYNVEDHIYEYVTQQNMEDFLFLEERCAFEGCAFLVYDGKLTVYGEQTLESESKGNLMIPNSVPFQYEDHSNDAYGKCMLNNGSVTGIYESGQSSRVLNKVINVRISSQAEANRFAKNLLRFENKKMTTATCESDIFLPEYAAGSTITIETPGVKSWNGAVFCTHVRHDLMKARSKLFFRKPLEGY